MKPKPMRVMISMHPVVLEHLVRLQKTGLFGVTLAKVAEGLMLRGLREAILAFPPEDSK